MKIIIALGEMQSTENHAIVCHCEHTVYSTGSQMGIEMRERCERRENCNWNKKIRQDLDIKGGNTRLKRIIVSFGLHWEPIQY